MFTNAFFLRLCITFVLIALSLPSWAKQNDDDTDDNAAQVSSSRARSSLYYTPSGVNRFSVGTGYSYFNYREPGLMTDSGSFYGLTGKYEYVDKHMPFRVGAESNISWGLLQYTGQLWTGEPLNDSTSDWLFNLRGIGQWDFRGSWVVVSPYAGVGFRYLNDQGLDSASYEREILYYYLPVGGKFLVRANDQISWGGGAEYDVFISGTVNTHLSQVNSNYADITNTQSSGGGYRAFADMNVRLRQSILQIQLYWQHWAIDDSDKQVYNQTATAVSYGQEPANASDQVGVTLSWAL